MSRMMDITRLKEKVRRGAFPHLGAVAFCFLVCGTAISCSSAGLSGLGEKSDAEEGEDEGIDQGEKTKTENKGEDPGETADQPVWINATFLTCALAGSPSPDDVKVHCLLDQKEEAPAPPRALDVTWTLLDDKGQTIETHQEKLESKSAADINRDFVVPAKVVSTRTVRVEVLADGEKGEWESIFAKDLFGTPEGAALKACLEETVPASDCLENSETTPLPTNHRVFATSSLHTGAFGGLAGADAICNSLATDAGLGGKWLAILSTSTQNAKRRINIDKPVANMKGEIVADGKAGFWSEGHKAPMSYDEKGQSISGSVWTGSGNDGQAAEQQCGDWSDPDENDTPVGDPAALNDWANDGVDPDCDEKYHLYCIDGQ